MEVIVNKTPKPFRVRLAFETYSVGNVIYPTGLWRDSLLARGFIEAHVEDKPATVAQEQPAAVVAGPETDKRPRRKQHGHDAL